MKQAIGLIEVKGYGTAISIADVMLKVAAVELIGVQRAKGSGWMTIEVNGDVGAVQAAVDAGKAKAAECNQLVSALVIPRPAQSLEMLTDNVDYPKKAKPVQPKPEPPKPEPKPPKPAEPQKETEAPPALRKTTHLTVQKEDKPENIKPEKKIEPVTEIPEPPKAEGKEPPTDPPAEKKPAKPKKKEEAVDKEKPEPKKTSKKPKNTKKKQ